MFVATFSFSQTITPKDIEKDLVQVSSKIFPFYYSNQDSLEFYSNLFTDKISSYITKFPSTLDYPFQSLIDSNSCSIVTSADGKFRIYSWDTWLGGTMHFFKNIIQFKLGDKVYCKKIDCGEDCPSGFYSQIFTLTAESKTYYLAINNSIYSTKDASQSIKVFAIENNSLNDTLQLFKTKTELLNIIDVNFDFFSVVNRPERPLRLIKYDAEKKIVYIPIVTENGKVTDRFILYQFNGQYLEHILTQKTKSVGK